MQYTYCFDFCRIALIKYKVLLLKYEINKFSSIKLIKSIFIPEINSILVMFMAIGMNLIFTKTKSRLNFLKQDFVQDYITCLECL